MSFTRSVSEFYDKGFAIIPDFLGDSEVRDLSDECKKLVLELDPNDPRSVFSTGEKQTGDEYFIGSGDKVRFFYESGAFDDKGHLQVEKEKSLNKIGHALHWLDPVFKRITFSSKIKALVKEIGFQKPVVPQSMYIFKHPGIGGEVVPHQDASFLYTEPTIRVVGFWFPLQDVTLENGCLHFIPGSHKCGLSRRFIRNPDKSPPLIFTEASPQYEEDQFIPVPVSKGSCVLIHGLVVHKSERNNSLYPRPAYTFHVIDTEDTQWAQDNWLQPTDHLPFPSLNDN